MHLVRPPSRAATTPPSEDPDDGSAWGQSLLPAFAIVWLVSAMRVAGAVWSREVFGAEATLALAAVVLIPVLVAKR